MREDFRDLLEVEDYGRYAEINIGDYDLVVLSGLVVFMNKPYCCEVVPKSIPNQVNEDYRQYKSMEIALFKGSNLITDDEILRGFSRFEELKGYEDILTKRFAYVPIDLIQDLYDYLKGYEQGKQAIERLNNAINEFSKAISIFFNNIAETLKEVKKEEKNKVSVYVSYKEVPEYDELELYKYLNDLKDKEIEQLKSTVVRQDENIIEILDEMEEYESEIYNLNSIVAGHSMASREKDKYIEQLEGCILNQREEIMKFNLVDKSIDMASFNNVGTDEVINKFIASFSLDTLKNLGIGLDNLEILKEPFKIESEEYCDNEIVINEDITLVDLLMLDNECSCGNDGAFELNVNGNGVYICTECLINLGKSIFEVMK